MTSAVSYYAVLHPYEVGLTQRLPIRYATDAGAKRCNRGMARLFTTQDAAMRAAVKCAHEQKAIISVWSMVYDRQGVEVIQFVSARADITRRQYLEHRQGMRRP